MYAHNFAGSVGTPGSLPRSAAPVTSCTRYPRAWERSLPPSRNRMVHPTAFWWKFTRMAAWSCRNRLIRRKGPSISRQISNRHQPPLLRQPDKNSYPGNTTANTTVTTTATPKSFFLLPFEALTKALTVSLPDLTPPDEPGILDTTLLRAILAEYFPR